MPMPAGIRAAAIRRIANSVQNLVPRLAHTNERHSVPPVADQSASDRVEYHSSKMFSTQYGTKWQNKVLYDTVRQNVAKEGKNNGA